MHASSGAPGVILIVQLRGGGGRCVSNVQYSMVEDESLTESVKGTRNGERAGRVRGTGEGLGMVGEGRRGGHLEAASASDRRSRRPAGRLLLRHHHLPVMRLSRSSHLSVSTYIHTSTYFSIIKQTPLMTKVVDLAKVIIHVDLSSPLPSFCRSLSPSLFLSSRCQLTSPPQNHSSLGRIRPPPSTSSHARVRRHETRFSMRQVWSQHADSPTVASGLVVARRLCVRACVYARAANHVSINGR
ncbi:hypothetical protein HDK90DRAFT_311853 [Phyllosticta capitalensis]|uniref:Uncharacterized protein n=1 Tax=Phyllosticta capitalensis TaxID=121624 RepID=A0ABR1YL63_9PEZI